MIDSCCLVSQSNYLKNSYKDCDSLINEVCFENTFISRIRGKRNKLDVTKTGNGEWGMGNGEWGMENGKLKWEIENEKLIIFLH